MLITSCLRLNLVRRTYLLMSRSVSTKLYLGKISPPARAVEITAKTIGLKPEVIYFNLTDGDHLKSSDLSKINPKCTIPSLDDDGFLLWDSHAIMIYLVEKYAKGNPLYPEDIKTRSLIHQRMFFECGDLFAKHLSVAGALVFSGEKITEEKKQIVAKNYDVVEHFLQDGKFIAGDQVTIADISIWCTISNTMTYSPLDETKYPNTKAWFTRMKDIPHAGINIEGSKTFGKLIETLNNK